MGALQMTVYTYTYTLYTYHKFSFFRGKSEVFIFVIEFFFENNQLVQYRLESILTLIK